MATVSVKPVIPPGPAVSMRYAGPSERTGGVGGWDDITRSRRDAAAEYVGTPPLELRVPVLVNGIDVNKQARGSRRDESVEPKVRQIEALGQRTTKTGEPPVLTLSGPVLHGGLRWVLADIEPGPYEMAANGDRVKAEFVLVFKRYLAADTILSPAKRSGRAATTKPRTTRVLKADLRQGLAAVSAREYGTSSRTGEIAKLNGIRDPKNIRVGQVLRLP